MILFEKAPKPHTPKKLRKPKSIFLSPKPQQPISLSPFIVSWPKLNILVLTVQKAGKQLTIVFYHHPIEAVDPTPFRNTTLLQINMEAHVAFLVMKKQWSISSLGWGRKL